MIRWAMPCLIVALASACSTAPPRIDSRPLGNQVSQSTDRFIIVAVDNAPAAFVAHAGGTPHGYDTVADYSATAEARAAMRGVEHDYGLREVNAWPIAPLHIHCAVLEIPAGADRNRVLAVLSKDKRVKLTQPLQTFATRTDGYNDPYVGLQRGFQQMDVADAHPWSRGEGVKVAIIDTGVDIQHPDLRGSIAAAVNFVDADDAQFQRDRHGTEMAGVIAAVANNREGIVGVAPNARLLVFKACWQARSDSDAARCNSFTLARALTAAFDAHAQVVNLSLAGPDDPLLGDLIREGRHRGVLFVGAAPDTAGVQDGLLHHAGVIEVASAETHSAIDSVLYAPGREILTLLPGGHYDFASGASIATAQVSGVIALMLARSPTLSSAAAYRLLRDTSSSLQTDGGGVMGIDACAAVVTVVRQGSCHTSEGNRVTVDENGNRVALH
ncbi:MAG TPA: S8 family serine peptidase [Steroidobacteraceae bacterium]|jgi:subtilisin family serine protease|nr:S8 family serine peptidase [Steroidobacteraceae bacterium]